MIEHRTSEYNGDRLEADKEIVKRALGDLYYIE
jgi:hypothetical protein